MKGELAIEVVIERSFARQSGDAWRTVLDACLSVMHLIDTRRSIPYGIKQVGRLLGISCSFEQSVQVIVMQYSVYKCSASVYFFEN
ncbi:hypothetical protein KFK09_021996 [Dendrobium nobile]|uniref:Uncharacterized protein n=1 Tax=Dendrobium nobile TaxID=94219 RepID=A0A8T3AHN0_DENNO|nr:hypothetical protein KFK09_021996 [Dendrobium nobile]